MLASQRQPELNKERERIKKSAQSQKILGEFFKSTKITGTKVNRS